MLPVDQVTLQRDQDARARERLQTVVRIARNREVPHSCEDDGGSFTCFWGIDLLLGTLELFLPFPFGPASWCGSRARLQTTLSRQPVVFLAINPSVQVTRQSFQIEGRRAVGPKTASVSIVHS